MGKRIEYFDTIKGIAIVLVVFCHYVVLSNDSFGGNIMMSLAWAAVPCFFLVTGGLMHKNEKFERGKYFRRIVKVYIVLSIWKLIYLVVYGIMNHVTFTKVELVKYLFLFGDISNVDTGLMWFMYAYLTALLFFPITYFLFHNGKDGRRILVYIAVLLFARSIFVTSVDFLLENMTKVLHLNTISIQQITMINPYGSYPNMMFYFVVGALLLEYRSKIEHYLKKYKSVHGFSLILIIVGMIGLLLIKFYDIHSFRWQGVYLQNGYNRFATLLLAIGMYLLIQSMEGNRLSRFLAEYIGKETMGIYYLHFPITAILLKYINPLIVDQYSLGLNVIKTVIVLALCIFITRVLKRVPFVKKLVS